LGGNKRIQSPPLVKATVIESLLFLKLPHPNPPLIKGRELIFPVSPKYIGGIKGGNLICVYTVAFIRGIKEDT
jgi:hypothetical protein